MVGKRQIIVSSKLKGTAAWVVAVGFNTLAFFI